jgi:hypothetical protein
MKLGTGVFCSLVLGAILMLLPSRGPSMDDSAKELEGEMKGKDVRYVVLACDAVIDNQTGEELTVHSSFLSAFDGLRVQLLRDGRTVGEKPYIFHQSPAGAPRPFVLKKGMNYKEIRIPFRLPPEDWPKLQAKLVGDLPGSAFKEKLESKAVPIRRVSTLEP